MRKEASSISSVAYRETGSGSIAIVDEGKVNSWAGCDGASRGSPRVKAPRKDERSWIVYAILRTHLKESLILKPSTNCMLS